MQGNLKQIQLPEVLQFISMGKSTGLLTVRDGNGVDTALMIRQGRIINSSALERQRRLGDLLVHRGFLRRSTLAQVLALQRTIESDKRLGQILVERELVQDAQIKEVLKLQLEEEIWNLFGLEEGEFKFDQVEDAKLGEATLQIDIEPLLLEGTRRQDEWRKIIRILPNDRLVLGVKHVAVPERQEGDDPKPKLSPAEWKVLAQVNGRFPIRAIVNRAGMGRFEVYQILAKFLRDGVVFIKPESAAELSDPESTLTPLPTSGPISSRGVGGLFSRLTGGGRRDDKGEKLAFVTPVGSLVFFANRLLDNFLSSRDVKPLPGDARLAETIWREMLIGYSKADLILVDRNRLNADRCEGYFRNFEFKDPVQDCYEDCLEALLQYCDSLYRQFAQRIGERPAAKIVRETLDESVPRISNTYGPDFKLEERVQMVLRLAA
ncbi:hypothetical protein BH09SUM1_BH09SUM1_03810 [soil metagenome]